MGSIHIQMLPKALAAGAPPQTPNSEGERFRPLPSLTRRVENGVKAIQKWVPFTPKCSQKRWRLGLRPRPPIARESGRAPLALASLTRKIENGVNAIQKWVPFTPNCSQVPKALVAGAPPQTPPPPNSEGERLCACQSDTPKGGAPIPIFAPGARNPRYATVSMQCNAMRHGHFLCNAMRCKAMQYDSMRCNSMKCDATRFNAMQCNTMQCDPMRCNAMQ